MSKKPLVALVGRPNVGKSTLFNRLVGARLAIVEDIPGTTRDRQYADAEWQGRVFTVVDTGGLVLTTSDEIAAQVRAQAQVAIDEADVIVFIGDILDGLMGADADIGDVLRRTQKPIILAINKADNTKRELNVHEFYALGLGDPLPISAIQGTGVGELLEAITRALPMLPPEEEEKPHVLHIALIGRTNVGKSSLLNRILGEERVIVSELPGTTRDAIDTTVRFHGQEIVLIDTAGIRRRGRIEGGIEKYSVLRALKAINRADVVLLLLDAVDGVTAQDAHIAGYIREQAKSIIVLVNKWDLIEKDNSTQPQYEVYVRRELKFMPFVPLLFVSALTGQRVSQILPLALRINEQRQQRLSTEQINTILREATARHSPPSKYGTKLRFYYGTQVDVNPPTFVFFVNDERLVHFSYERYLENQIREHFRFEGSPLRLIFRGHEEKSER
jgi:GTP-binding protein